MVLNKGLQLGLVVLATSLTACERFGNGSADAVSRVKQKAIENLVFVEGGTFKLGDVGHPNGSPYVVLTDHARPAVDVSVDSYSISKYETTWGEMRVYYEKVGHISLYEGVWV